jgi:hypothetical protein
LFSLADRYTIKTFFSDHALGQKELDGRQFAKMAKDTNLLDKVKPVLCCY